VRNAYSSAVWRTPTVRLGTGTFRSIDRQTRETRSFHGLPSIRRQDNQTPSFMAEIEAETHRAKLAKNGEDTH
jgi:hypothetical protein